jgi:hypothetical protein
MKNIAIFIDFKENEVSSYSSALLDFAHSILHKDITYHLFSFDAPSNASIPNLNAEIKGYKFESTDQGLFGQSKELDNLISILKNAQIDEGILTEALDNLRNGMAITLSQDDRQILAKVYRDYYPEDPKQQEFLDLLHTIYVIEYRNKDSWYDVNPLIVEQLRREGKIG